LIAVDIIVAYRKPFPNEETVNLVKEKLKENKIDYNQLLDWLMENCTEADSTTEEGCSS
jgi:hypothetical protein